MYLQLNAESYSNKSFPVSPVSPVYSKSNYNTMVHSKTPMSAEYKQNKKICKVLKKIGLYGPSKLADTMQGT